MSGAKPNSERDNAPGCLGAFFALRDRVGAWCGALGLIGAAFFLYDGPQEIRDEIVYYREIAIGCGIFGGLMILALVLRGNAGYRVRSLLLAVLSSLVGGFLIWWISTAALDIWALKATGEIRRVEVIGTTMKQNPKTHTVTKMTQVSIDGQRISAKIRGNHRRGQTITILVAPKRPTAIVSASVEKEWLTLIDELIGRWIALLLVSLTLFCVFALPINLWHFLTGPPQGVDPEEGRP
ncbi:MAG: hypothetical protein ACI97A_004319 [Planctomycetota bacterium]|jgi:hypothetical protein